MTSLGLTGFCRHAIILRRTGVGADGSSSTTTERPMAWIRKMISSEVVRSSKDVLVMLRKHNNC